MATPGSALLEVGAKNNAAAKRRVILTREIGRMLMFFLPLIGFSEIMETKASRDVLFLLGGFIFSPTGYLLSYATPKG
jgi:hypothetical protein